MAKIENSIDERYLSGDYLDKNPTFHVERAQFKASLVAAILQRNGIKPRTLCDLGCGAGEVLRLLCDAIPSVEIVHGYELSPQGYAMCQQRQYPKLKFFNLSLFETQERYDLGITLDVFEHVEDPFSFLRNFRQHAQNFVFHIPLDMNAQMVLRGSPIMNARRTLGHLHYFSKDSALALLRETGYEIIDHQYTPSSIHKPKTIKAKLAKIPRQIAKAALGDFGVRLTGGYSLLVIAK